MRMSHVHDEDCETRSDTEEAARLYWHPPPSRLHPPTPPVIAKAPKENCLKPIASVPSGHGRIHRGPRDQYSGYFHRSHQETYHGHHYYPPTHDQEHPQESAVQRDAAYAPSFPSNAYGAVSYPAVPSPRFPPPERTAATTPPSPYHHNPMHHYYSNLHYHHTPPLPPPPPPPQVVYVRKKSPPPSPPYYSDSQGAFHHAPPPPPPFLTPVAATTAGRPRSSPVVEQTIVYDVRDADVLCGRGAPSHPGNQYFRRLVASMQSNYLASRRSEKPEIAHEIVRAVQDRGGRFLKRTKVLSQTHASGSHFCWQEVGQQRAYEKACQALREGAPEWRRRARHVDDDGGPNQQHDAAAFVAATAICVDDGNSRGSPSFSSPIIRKPML